MRGRAVALATGVAVLTTGCGAFVPVMAEGRVKVRIAESPMFTEKYGVQVTVLESSVKQVKDDESGAGPRTVRITRLQRDDLPKEIVKGSVVECEVQIRRKFQSNDWGEARASDCELTS